MRAAEDREHVERFRTEVARRLGLSFDDEKLADLGEVVGQRARETGCGGADSYLDRLASPAGWHEEWRSLAERLTVGETYFFRYRAHFSVFSDLVLPAAARSANGQRPLRILSAGCASGEEAYSLAILVKERCPDMAAAGRIRIQGIDVNPSMIEKARQARYSAWALRDAPVELRERYFRLDGRESVLADPIRGMVSFEERNLVGGDGLLRDAGAFDVVFCRNVIMYFCPEAARSVVAAISQALRPEGFLFLGHAETLRGLSEAFHLRHTHETFYYQRRALSEVHPMTALPGAPRPSPPTPPLGPALEEDASWVDVIHRASSRIATLAGGSGRESAPAPTPLVRPATGAAWDLGLALDLLRHERFEEALQWLQTLPPESQDDTDAQLLRAVLLTNCGNAAAEDACRRLLEVDELSAGAHYLMSLCREHAGDRLGAVEHDRTAVYLDPAFAMPRLHLGLLARRSGDRDGARRDLGQALVLLAREDASRILLFGGGFSREALVELCRTELRAAGELS